MPLDARAREPARVPFDDAPTPPFAGRASSSRARGRCATYIDWTFFFPAWELKGHFPAILERPGRRASCTTTPTSCSTRSSPTVRCGPRRLRLLARARGGRRHRRSATARASDSAASRRTRRHARRTSRSRTTSRLRGDHVGAFGVGVHGADELATSYEAEHDDYRRSWSRRSPTGSPRRSRNSCTCARAASGTRPDESLSRGRSHRRAIPRHPARVRLSGLPRPLREAEALRPPRADEAGIELTESFATLPAASVSGLYLAHPEAKYFSVGRIGRDQVEDYARRKAIATGEAERRLRPVLST